jgi:hypothetical protein
MLALGRYNLREIVVNNAGEVAFVLHRPQGVVPLSVRVGRPSGLSLPPRGASADPGATGLCNIVAFERGPGEESSCVFRNISGATRGVAQFGIAARRWTR